MTKEEALAEGYTHVVPTPDNRRVYYFRSFRRAELFAAEIGTRVHDLKWVAFDE